VKPKIFIFLLFLLFPLHSSDLWAESSEISAAKFTLGIASAYMLHEAGHFATAVATGTRIDMDLGKNGQLISFTEYSDSKFKGFAIDSAGLITQEISSEVILQVDSIDKNDWFIRGMMLWNILNPVWYSLDYWFIHSTNKINDGYRGDIAGIEYYSSRDTANGYALAMTAIAAYQGYRFFKTQSWAPEWIKSNKGDVSITPLASGGFMVGYKLDF
jgi:hypothetical protein